MSLDKKSLLKDLARLVDHPDTPAHERESALARIREIELHLSKAIVQNRKKAGIASLAGRFAKTLKPKDEWPFAWNTRSRISCQYTPVGDGGILVWACPACGIRVEESIRGDLLRRLLGKPDGINLRIEHRSSGKLNQLCNVCWKVYE